MDLKADRHGGSALDLGLGTSLHFKSLVHSQELEVEALQQYTIRDSSLSEPS
jgi:hypothetical protein